MIILSNDILPLKISQKFSSMLEPYAVKVASTVLSGGCHCEVMFLPDEVPPKVEYSLTIHGERLVEIFATMTKWGEQYAKDMGAIID